MMNETDTARINNIRACLHEGGGPQIGEVTCGGSPHLSCKHDEIKMRDNMDKCVTHQSGLPQLPGVSTSCKQAIRIDIRLACVVGNKWAQEKTQANTRCAV